MSVEETLINTSHFMNIMELGFGSSCSVHLVKKLGGSDDGRLYALKELSHACNMEPERTILNMLDDFPFISKMYYHFEEKGKGYLILDYCGGGSIEKYLSPAVNLSEEAIRYLLAETILGIESFHSLGVIHRDIKPDNILMDNDGHVVIIDFGLAMILTEEVSKGHSSCGTAGFIAPEVDEGYASGYDQTADFFSLGVTAYLLANRKFPPHAQHITLDTIDTIHSKLSSEFRDFVSRLLLRSPHERLGGGGGGTEALKNHPFFKDMNWSELAKKNIKSPFL